MMHNLFHFRIGFLSSPALQFSSVTVLLFKSLFRDSASLRSALSIALHGIFFSYTALYSNHYKSPLGFLREKYGHIITISIQIYQGRKKINCRNKYTSSHLTKLPLSGSFSTWETDLLLLLFFAAGNNQAAT